MSQKNSIFFKGVCCVVLDYDDKVINNGFTFCAPRDGKSFQKSTAKLAQNVCKKNFNLSKNKQKCTKNAKKLLKIARKNQKVAQL